MLPVVLAILLFSFISYRYSKSALETYYKEERMVILDEIKSLLSFYDFAMRAHEKNYSERMREISDLLVNTYFINSDRPDTFNLYRICERARIDTTSEFIYIINENGKIENTTFRKDLGLDFGKLDTAYLSFFKKVWQDTIFVEDRFGHEINSGKIKKYAYQPTKKGKFIVELGFYSQTAVDLKALLEEKAAAIAHKFKEIKELNLLVGVENLHHYAVREDHFDAYNSCIKNKSNERIVENTDSGTITYDYIFLEIAQASMYSGYVIKIVSDDSKERELVWSEIKKFTLIFLLTALPLFILIFIRARQITRPIKNLTEKTNQIAHGDLRIRAVPEGNNEITELSEHFNKMVSDLEESYNTLEHKVIERTAELQEQKELVEEKNKEILDSIHYAKRIQEAILPPEKFVKTHLPESFILYKPKDIVAGDFYWLESVCLAEVPEKRLILFAACDCTGHGVPGAMVSVVSNNALNRAVREFNLYLPNEILDKVNELVEETFSKSESEVKDGMDVSLCGLDYENRKLLWSGANNPLWILRKDKNENYDCIEIKANKQPIGKYDNRVPFSLHEIQLQDSDVIIIFSDGFADQFGGPSGKKFKYAQLKALLLENAKKSAGEIHQLLSFAFENWRGSLEQIDDVCIIGVKI